MFVRLKNAVKRIGASSQKKAVLLCYHRISNESLDPWNIVVSPKNFDEQLQVLTEYFSPADINDLVNRFSAVATTRSVSLTFDDGYVDNYTVAAPLLTKYNVPACFFIASGFTGKNISFWWDELADLILTSSVLPSVLAIDINHVLFRFDLGHDAILSNEVGEKIAKWKYHQPVPSARCTLFLELWKTLMKLSSPEHQEVMERLRTWSNFYNQSAHPERFAMNETELTALAQNPLFTIGLHTVNHAALGYHSPGLQESEIGTNKEYLEKLIGREVDILSFPYGSYSSESVRLAKQLKLSACFNSEKRKLKANTDQYKIGRFAVKDWNGIVFRHKLKSWFNNG